MNNSTPGVVDGDKQVFACDICDQLIKDPSTMSRTSHGLPLCPECRQEIDDRLASMHAEFHRSLRAILQ